ncbi:hypothetical protein N431DRAFT_149005 [Stipitochalara longipes BDJ]|nr:hypothetical protein N431DRAFT_149005 [Stipitochalara longipes BDJ]
MAEDEQRKGWSFSRQSQLRRAACSWTRTKPRRYWRCWPVALRERTLTSPQVLGGYFFSTPPRLRALILFCLCCRGCPC